MTAPLDLDRDRQARWRRRLIRRQPWENIATAIIAAGVLMLLQPLSMTLYTYSFVTMLAGVAMFMIVGKFPD